MIKLMSCMPGGIRTRCGVVSWCRGVVVSLFHCFIVSLLDCEMMSIRFRHKVADSPARAGRPPRFVPLPSFPPYFAGGKIT